MRRVRYEAEAAEELAAAVGWYEDERPGLGAALLDEIDSVVAGLASGSTPSAPVRGTDEDVRRVVLARFPYSIVFLEHAEVVRIVAVVHHKRAPGYWTDRLRR